MEIDNLTIVVSGRQKIAPNTASAWGVRYREISTADRIVGPSIWPASPYSTQWMTPASLSVAPASFAPRSHVISGIPDWPSDREPVAS